MWIHGRYTSTFNSFSANEDRPRDNVEIAGIFVFGELLLGGGCVTSDLPIRNLVEGRPRLLVIIFIEPSLPILVDQAVSKCPRYEGAGPRYYIIPNMEIYRRIFHHTRELPLSDSTRRDGNEDLFRHYKIISHPASDPWYMVR